MADLLCPGAPEALALREQSRRELLQVALQLAGVPEAASVLATFQNAEVVISGHFSKGRRAAVSDSCSKAQQTSGSLRWFSRPSARTLARCHRQHMSHNAVIIERHELLGGIPVQKVCSEDCVFGSHGLR